MRSNHVSGMRGWSDICSDVSWDDYGGAWAREAPRKPGVYYVVQFTNMVDACGEREAAEMGYVYEASVYMLDLSDIGDAEIDSALQSSGWAYDRVRGVVTNDYDDETVADGAHAELAIVQACRSYGLGAPLASFTGKVRPAHVRAEARRYAETCIRDAALLATRLARPVNAIGSTAAEYGRGDINSALYRGDSPMHALMRKISAK